MPENSIFRIYSITKPIISAAATLLSEAGLIYLNENLYNYISNSNNMKASIEFIDSKNNVKENQFQQRIK